MRSFVVMIFMLLVTCYGATAQDTSCGIVWEPPILLSDTAHDAYSPKIALSGNDTVHLTWEGGKRLSYIRSVNGGKTFQSVRELLTDSIKYPFATAWQNILTYKDYVYLFFVGGDNGLTTTPIRMLVSNDRGDSWNGVKDIGPDTTGLVSSAAIDENTIALVYASPSHYRNILHSTDNGVSWIKTSEDLQIFAQISLGSGALYLVQNVNGEVEYRRSYDIETTWNDTTILSTVDGIYSSVPVIASNDSITFVAWREAKYGCLTLVGCGQTGRLSLNNGTTFEPEQRYDEQPAGVETSVSVHGDAMAIAWTDDLDPVSIRIRVSTDHGTTWCPPYPVGRGGRANIAITSSAVHVVWVQRSLEDKYVISYRRGVFLPTDVSVERDVEQPQQFNLKQNYPNPFNPATTIQYAIPTASYITLRVYDILGREIETLVNERKDPGIYTVEWIGNNLPSGVYIYKMITGTYTKTKKGLLLR